MGKHFECSCPLAVSLREIPFCLSISPWLTDCWADARLKTPSEELGKWWVDSGDIVDFSWLCNIIEMENCFQVDFWKEQVDGMLFILMNFRGLPSNFIYWPNLKKFHLVLFDDLLCLICSMKYYLLWNTLGSSSGTTLHKCPAVHSASSFPLTQGIYFTFFPLAEIN